MLFDVNREHKETTSIVLRDTASKVMFACVSCFLPFPTILSIHICASRYWTILGTDQCGKVNKVRPSQTPNITLSLWCVSVNAADIPYIYKYVIDYIL